MFVAKGCFTRHSIKKFAQEVAIAPGIVVGRLQHERLIRFDWLNDLKIKFDLVGEEG
jgi:hypothetical protein